ncbi:hypothetical protein RYX36_037291 [Vicia faba]
MSEAGERKSTKMRIKYLEASLKQDIEFFDMKVRTSDVVFTISIDSVMVQDAINSYANPSSAGNLSSGNHFISVVEIIITLLNLLVVKYTLPQAAEAIS